MNQERKEFLERKEKVMKYLQDAINLLQDSGFVKEADILTAQYDNLQNEEFIITIVGEFSTGKSYLLNALIGDRLLPSYSDEATAAICFLRHKEKAKNGEAGCIYYKDGRVIPFDTADQATIEKYACTKSKGVTDIDHIDIFLDSKFLLDNVTLVDTPGLNGLISGHADMTKQQIEKSSASVFLFSAKQPGKETDFAALAMIRKRVNSIILVLTQADLIEGNESVDTIIHSLETKYNNDYPNDKKLTKFHPLSAKMALAGRSAEKIEIFGRTDYSPEEKIRLIEKSGMLDFEEYLFAYLTKGPKGRQMLLGPAVQLNNQLENVNNSIDTECSLLNGNADAKELEAARLKLEEAIASIREIIESKTSEIRSTITAAQTEFKEELAANASSLESRFRNRINNFTDIEDINPDVLKKGLETGIRQILEDAMSGYTSRIKEVLSSFNKSMDGELLNSLGLDGFSAPSLGELQLTSLDSGLDVFERDLAELRRESDKLQQQIEEAEDDAIKARRLAAERARISRKIDRLEENKDEYRRTAIINMPDVLKGKRQKEVYQERDGFFGGIIDTVFGRKRVPEFEDYIDSSARDEYQRQMSANLGEYTEEIAQLQSQYDHYSDVDPAQAERIEERLRKKYEERRKKELELQKEFADKIKKVCARQLQTQKEEITDYVTEAVRQLKNIMDSYFRNSQDSVIQMIVAMVTGSMTEAIEEKMREIDTIKRQALLQANEREQRLAELDELLKKLRPMRLDALDLKEELEAIDEVVIE